MRLSFVSFILIVLTSCCDRKNKYEKEYYQELYRQFSHVEERVDSIKEVSTFHIDSKPLGKQEKDTLLMILKEFHKDFKVTTDNEIFVSLASVPTLYEMYTLDVELSKRISK